MCLFTVEELVVVGGPISACPTSPSMILVWTMWSRQVLARKAESVDFPESTSPRMIASPLVRTRASAAFRQLGGMVDPLTCLQTPCSPMRTRKTASESVSIGSLRCFATTSVSPGWIVAPMEAALPSSSVTDAGPSTRRVLSFESLTSEKCLPP